MNDDLTKYYNIKTRREKHINPFEKPEKKNIESYNQIINYPRKEYFSKLKYRYPSLEKFEYNIPHNFSIDLKSPIYENTQFYKKKNLHLSVSMKNIEIIKENINKQERILPSFTIPNKKRIIDQMRKEEEKEIKRLEKKYNDFRKQKREDTTQKFFKSISKNILQNNKIHIRNMKGLINDNNKSNNKSNLFLTGEQNPNYYFNPFNNLNQELLNSIENKKNDNIIDDLGFNNGREIISDRGYKIRSKRSDINFVDPNIDKNYHDIIRIESAVKKILASPNY
jgi:hypothetical protein